MERAIDIITDLKNDVFILCYIINEALNFFYKLGVMTEFIQNLHPKLKQTLEKTILFLQETNKETSFVSCPYNVKGKCKLICNVGKPCIGEKCNFRKLNRETKSRGV